MDSGCMLGLDTWADTCCVGKHALINEVIEGKSVTATGFASSLKAIPNLPIVNCSLAYDTNEGRTYILRINNAIYLGEQMTNCLLCPNQCEVNNIRIDLRPTKFYPDSGSASTIYCSNDELKIPIQHKGPLPFINVRRPTLKELDNCATIELTPTDDWNPSELKYDFSPSISEMTHTIKQCDDELQCSISGKLDHMIMYNSIVSNVNVIFDFDTTTPRAISALATRKKDKLTPEDLMRLWGIGFKTAKRTLQATTHQCLNSVENLRRRF